MKRSIECAPEQRDALLLDVIRRSFPDLAATRCRRSRRTRADADAVADARAAATSAIR